MSIFNETKINILLRNWPPGTVRLASWLAANGVSNQLLARYRKSRWVESIGTGAVVRTGDDVDYLGGLYALQTQAGSSIHAGGRTAMSLHGRGQYLDLAGGRAVLVGAPGETLPTWFREHKWRVRIDYHAMSFLPAGLGLVDMPWKGFSVKVSSPERAMLECVQLAPRHQELFECYELMEFLTIPRPEHVQQLLERCSSVKAKRLFLYLAEKCGHGWLSHLQMGKIGLGTGTRSLVGNGVYNSKYGITVPREMERNGRPEL